MKKPIVFASLGLLAALACIVVAQRLHAAVGDCSNLKVEENADCDYLGNCAGITQGTCFSASFSCPNSTCNPDPCEAELATDVRTKGKCYNGWWDDGCIHCNRYICADGAAYQSRDSLGQCQNSRCSIFWYCDDCCIPDAGGD